MLDPFSVFDFLRPDVVFYVARHIERIMKSAYSHGS